MASVGSSQRSLSRFNRKLVSKYCYFTRLHNVSCCCLNALDFHDKLCVKNIISLFRSGFLKLFVLQETANNKVHFYSTVHRPVFRTSSCNGDKILNYFAHHFCYFYVWVRNPNTISNRSFDFHVLLFR